MPAEAVVVERNLVGDSAHLSPCGEYRYWLTRGAGTRPLLVVMLNPSTADAFTDDPTIRRLRTFVRRWGYGPLLVANLFALRSADPSVLWTAPDPVGPLNPNYLSRVLDAARVLVAWGAHPAAEVPGEQFLKLGSSLDVPLYCLGTTSSGAPIHPMARGRYRVADDTEPRPWLGYAWYRDRAAEVAEARAWHV